MVVVSVEGKKSLPCFVQNLWQQLGHNDGHNDIVRSTT